MPKLHGLFILAGHRGAGRGKGVAVTSMLRQMKRAGCADRIFWLSSTCASNKCYLDELGVAKEDQYEHPDNDALQAVISEVTSMAAEYRQYKEAKQVYHRLHTQLQRGKDVTDIDNDLLMQASRLGLLDTDEEPKYKYGKDTPAVCHLVIDDAQGTKLLSSSGSKSILTNTAIRHRHIGDGFGLTMWICVQSWRASGSVPRAIRENCTGALLWRCPQERMVQQMADELASGRESLDTFREAYNIATERDHGFLFVDMTTTDPMKRYRAGWNTYLLPKKSLVTENDAIRRQKSKVPAVNGQRVP
jgi:hypothetical protein